MPISARLRSSVFVVCAWFLSVSASGCGMSGGDDLPREAITGTVSLDGQPLSQGAIQFLPGTNREGVSAGAVIKDGSFSIDRAQGLVPGLYRVVINSSLESEPAPAPDEAPGAIAPAKGPSDRIPPQYNKQSKLEAEVKAGGPNAFDYPLKTK